MPKKRKRMGVEQENTKNEYLGNKNGGKIKNFNNNYKFLSTFLW